MSGPAGCAAAEGGFQERNAVREVRPSHMGAIPPAGSSTQTQIARLGWRAAGTGVSVRTKPGLRCRPGFVAVLRYAGRLVNGAGDRLPPYRRRDKTGAGGNRAEHAADPDSQPGQAVSDLRNAAQPSGSET